MGCKSKARSDPVSQCDMVRRVFPDRLIMEPKEFTSWAVIEINTDRAENVDAGEFSKSGRGLIGYARHRGAA